MKTFPLVVAMTLVATTSMQAQTSKTIDVGTYFGTSLSGGFRNPVIGLLLSAPAFGAFEWYPSVQALIIGAHGSDPWQASANIRFRPRNKEGVRAPWYVGGGFRASGRGIEPGLLIGVTPGGKNTRLFAEFRFGPFGEPSLLFGITLSFPRQR